MSVEKLVSNIVDYQVDIEKSVDSDLPEFRARIGELLSKPSERNTEIIDQFFESNLLSMVEETDDMKLSEAYFSKIAPMMTMTFDDINMIPPSERGGMYLMGVAILIGAAQQQAFIESLSAIESLQRGSKFGAENERAMRDIDPTELAGKLDLKKQIKDKRTADGI